VNKEFAGSISKAFINSKLTPLLMAFFLIVGLYSAWLTPREEEPQIEVPFIDIFVEYPGAGSEEVERRVSRPLEKLIQNIPGVEYVYSTSSPGQAMVIVRFYVGEELEPSLTRLFNEIEKHMDEMPSGVSMPLIKTRSIDDVPILGLTLWSDHYNDFELRKIGEELLNEIEEVDQVGPTEIIGGRNRVVSVKFDPAQLAAYNLDLLTVSQQIKMANTQAEAGSFDHNDTEYLVQTGNFLKTSEDVENLVVQVQQGSPIYLHQVAEVTDGPEEPASYVEFGFGKGRPDDYHRYKSEYPAVTLSVGKIKGADAMRVADKILQKMEHLEQELIPEGVDVEITRNYGETASDKVAELLMHLLAAIVAVTVVVSLAMGWRGGLVVFLSVPVTFALTLFVYYLFGYTLNRITLFALVFVTGIVVDDSIIVAENMHRHFKMRNQPFFQAAINSINEVGNPTILATFTVVAAVLPMAFVSGLMGPYMSPMPIGASLAMIFSLIVALVITPFLAYHLLSAEEAGEPDEAKESFKLEDALIYRIYAKFMMPLLQSPKKRWIFISTVIILLLGSVSLFYFKLVAVKMLPFDNKNEFSVIIDMPEGTTMERTAVVADDISAFLRQQPEVVHYQTYVGTASPINFNGLVRHYDLRRDDHMGDIQVNLLSKHDRSEQSHDIARRLRPEIQKIATKHHANVKIVEVPPGPPVQATLVAEIYGPDYQQQVEVARQIRHMFRKNKNIVDTDWTVEDNQAEYHFQVNKEKAMLTGITAVQVVKTIQIGLHGGDVTRLIDKKSFDSVPIRLRLHDKERTSVEDIKKLHVVSNSGLLVPVGDIVDIQKFDQEKSIYRKNQKRVIYVMADVTGRLESPVYAILDISEKLNEIRLPEGYELKEHYTAQPEIQDHFGLKWDGEWHITYQVFRDLGAAFAVVLIVIYMLIIGWFQDFKVPFTMMVAIPLSLVGILLGHWVMGAFFTATSMIGMIALAGIMVRNSILLIDFINLRIADNIPLKQAVIEAGAVRTTPILLTAGTVVIGAVVILLDPIFQGLAISLMGGSIASTALTLLMIPLIYYMTEKGKIRDESISLKEMMKKDIREGT